MSNNDISQGDVLEKARQLVDSLENGQEDTASSILEQLSSSRDSNLFQELGKLTRRLHEALQDFQLDSRLADLASLDIPDARDRLNYVITMTEQAANRTMDSVESTIPISMDLEQQSADLLADWERLRRRELAAQDFPKLYKQIHEFLTTTKNSASTIHGNLSDVLMAQDYQDLTGQVIRRVIQLVTDVEESLVQLIRVSGQAGILSEQEPKDSVAPSATEASGPVINPEGRDDVVQGQDDVDDLLSSLGF